VHGFQVGYWWAAGIYFATAIVCGVLIRPNTRMAQQVEAEALEAAAVA
jgi:hypothetical protein